MTIEATDQESAALLNLFALTLRNGGLDMNASRTMTIWEEKIRRAANGQAPPEDAPEE